MFSPPHGSNITIYDEDGYQEIVIPHKSGTVPQWFFAILHLFVFGLWLIAPLQILPRVNTGFRHPAEAVFVVVFLAVVLFGTLIQFWAAYRTLRPDIPEVLYLSKHEMLYDSGLAPLRYVFKRSEYWERLFQRRIEADFSPAQLKTLELWDSQNNARLTIYAGRTRIDMAPTSREADRQWLFDVLCKYYDIARQKEIPDREAHITAAAEKGQQKSTSKKARRETQECPYCQASTHIEVDETGKWQVCDACGWSGLVDGQK